MSEAAATSTHVRMTRATTITALCLLVGLAGAFPLAAVALAAALLVWFAFSYPRAATAAGAVMAALIRPLLDLFSDVRIAGGSPASVFGVMMFALGATIVVARLINGLRLWPNRLFALPQLMLIALHVSLFAGGLFFSKTGILAVEAREMMRFASTLTAGLMAVWWQDDSHDGGWQPALVLMVLASIIPLGTGSIQAVTGSGNHEDSNLNRVFGSFTHPLSYGSYLLPLVILGFAGFLRMRGLARGLALGYCALSATLLFLTYNRTTILLLLIGLTGYTGLQLRHVRLVDMLRLAGLAALVGFVTWLVFGVQIADRFSGMTITTGAVQEALASGSQNSFQWRIVNWAILIQLGLAHPIAGHGLGMTTVLNPLVQASSGVPFNAHNDYVRFFFEGGLIGLILYTAFVVTFAVWLWRAKQGLREADRSIAYAIVGSLAALFVFSAGTTEMSMQTGVLYPAYLLMAILVGAEARRDRGRDETVLVRQIESHS